MRKPRSGVAAVSVLLAGLICAVAQAQVPAAGVPDNPYVLKPQQYDPITSPWQYVAGMRFNDDGTKQSQIPAASPTPANLNFYAVDFARRQLGFAGGSSCDEDTPNEAGACNNPTPAIWKYTESAAGIGTWQKDATFPGGGTGFVGAIAFFPGSDRALAVGGTGRYPYTEPARDPAESDADYAKKDPAGAARAWLYEDGRWHELHDLPAGMRGLTALALSPRQGDCAGSNQCGFAGGFQQIWRWTDEGFVPETTPAIPYRVRAIRFVPGDAKDPKGNAITAIAATSGCCAVLPTDEVPKLLLYDRRNGGAWATSQRTTAPTGNNYEQGLPDSFYDLTVTVDPAGYPYVSLALSPGEADGPKANLAARVAGALPANNLVYTGLNLAVGTQECGLSNNGGSNTGETEWELASPRVGDLHLTAGDGDVLRPPKDALSGGGRNQAPLSMVDCFMDWAVGWVSSSGAGWGAGQGAAYTTTLDPHSGLQSEAPSPLDCHGASVVATLEQPVLDANAGKNPSVDPNACQAREASEIQSQEVSRSMLLLPTFRLNAFRMAGDSGVGWAVGDRGAIMKLGLADNSARVGAEPDSPRLGSHEPSALPDRSAYESFAQPPADGEPALVPPLTPPGEHSGSFRLVSGGSPDPDRLLRETVETVSSMAMSRDGSEGWAVGSQSTDASGSTALFHYDGARWTRCAPNPTGSQLPADPACAPLAGLANVRDNPSPNGVQIAAVARVPLENDSDPTNDDDFEAIAFGTNYTPAGGVLLRYADGRWSVDEQGSRQIGTALFANTTGASLACTSPGDCWLTNAAEHGYAHFDGQTGAWIKCESGPTCDDPGNPSLLAGLSHTRFTAVGERLYMYGSRAQAAGTGGTYPLILYRDADKPCGQAGDPGCWHYTDGGLDPISAGQASDSNVQGSVTSLSVTRNGDGSYSGWAFGRFGPGQPDSSGLSARTGVFYHLEPGSDTWSPWSTPDASADYYLRPLSGGPGNGQLLTMPGRSGEGGAVLIPAVGTTRPEDPPLEYDPSDRRWKVMSMPFSTIVRSAGFSTASFADHAYPQAITPDNQGGFWLALQHGIPYYQNANGFEQRFGLWFYHYTDQAPKPQFEDVPNPVHEAILATGAGGDGSFWVGTSSGNVYRHDRVTGWDRVPLRGWDAGRVVTNPTPVRALAVGPDGSGLAVGPQGRIADLSPLGAILDQAAGRQCTSPPCGGTSRDLLAAAVAPDGSAIVAGQAATVLWRPPGGDFTSVPTPDISAGTNFTGASFPAPDRAWLTTAAGEVYGGKLAGGSWSWQLEDTDAQGRALNLGPLGLSLGLHAISVNAQGHGFAVGDRGLVLERTGEGAHAWRRLATGDLGNFWSVTQPVGGGSGALIGGEYGQILTYDGGRFQVARQADAFDPVSASVSTAASRVVGLALLRGSQAGEVEAWAAQQVPFLRWQSAAAGGNRSPGPSAILHYTSDRSDPLLDVGSQAGALPDTPAPAPGALSFAAFGKSDCPQDLNCPEQSGTNQLNELITRRVTDAVTGRAGEPGGPQFALFTGDVSDAGSANDKSLAGDSPTATSVPHDNWRDLVADRLDEAGVPLFGALGAQDLSGGGNDICRPLCTQLMAARVSGPWRQSFAGMPAPWGASSDGPPSEHGLTFEPVPGGSNEAPGGGARTHYAVDVIRDGAPVLRLVVADTSHGSLAASEAQQNPVESQLTWLRDVLQRPAGEQAVVVSNDPSYTYDPQLQNGTETDGAAFESLMLQEHVNAVVSGRLGWNGLYYTLAPGLHDPCPGGAYPTGPPSGPPSCGAPTPTDPTGAANDVANQAEQAVSGTGTPGLTGALPTVVASGAGGKFGPDGKANGSASQGFWHGYAVVHLDPSGDPDKTIVEQRPVFDWVDLGPDPRKAGTHVIRAGRKLDLLGYGREAASADEPLAYDAIDSPAITHRYDLLEADPEKPWLPLEADDNGVRSTASNRVGEDDPCGPYLCLDPKVGTIDQYTGQVKAGGGNYPRTYAVAELSVGSMSATYPVVFEPRASYRPPRPPVTLPVVVPPPPPAAAPPPAQTPTAQLPAAPVLPVLAATAPPPPPAPPAPPTFASQAPIDLSISPTAIDVLPPTAVSQPPTPPVNPAPPSGARREARQRQAAAQKSGADSDQEQSEIQEAGGDPVDAGPDRAMTRHEFTAIADRSQPSAWTRDLLLGGGLGGAALILALGLGTAQPKPRRRQPDVPAPAWARSRRR